MPWVIGGLSLGLLVAGLISPRMGRSIQRHGGRGVLSTSSVLLGLGLAALAWSPNLAAYFASWALLGLGMGTGLYDAAFATLGRTYGAKARSAITALTLIAGFSSSICWPFSAFLAENYGWRTACLVYAAIHITLSLAVHATLIPRAPAGDDDEPTPPDPQQDGWSKAGDRELYVLAVALTLIAVVSAIMSVQLIILLKARGLEVGAAVAVAALLGPSQVGARLIEMLFGHRYHPIWTLILATALVGSGLVLLLLGFPPLAGVILYGGGIGIAWIARGTVPLAIFGSHDYAVRMGRIAFPSLIAQALAPSLGAAILASHGADASLAILVSAGFLALVCSFWLKAMA
jgi:predicted MFS family arabinose efflux permease